MATKKQRERQSKRRERHNHSTKQEAQTSNLLAEVIDINDYKGVKGMKRRIMKIVERIKERTNKVTTWIKKKWNNDDLMVGVAVGTVVGAAIFVPMLIVSFRQTDRAIEVIKAWREHHELHMESSKRSRFLLDHVSEFFKTHPDAKAQMQEFSKAKQLS